MTPSATTPPRDADHLPDARLIIANLDCEESWDREEGCALGPGDPLPLRLRRELAALGTLLRCLGREGDVVWTALPVRADRLAESTAPGIPHAVQQSAAWPSARPREILAWGETAAVQALRLAEPRPRSRALRAGVSDATPIALIDRLWSLPPAAPGVAGRVNHRLQQLALADRLGLALPGARPIDSLAALDAAMARLPRDAEGRWVLKSPLSAAGRGRVLGGATERIAAQRERSAAERLLSRHGTLLFEPWMPRTDDPAVLRAARRGGPRFPRSASSVGHAARRLSRGHPATSAGARRRRRRAPPAGRRARRRAPARAGLPRPLRPRRLALS
ncbi:MAG: hypothetical protein IPL40_15895 [Proteobacteria bacterium]|nr:hypothetical protein [Pseudomonadota bacterium]